MYDVTITGTTVKRLETDARSVKVGNNFGIGILPLSSFTMAIPAVIITKTTARPTDKAEVYFKESAGKTIE